jgi:hypothetical protein
MRADNCSMVGAAVAGAGADMAQVCRCVETGMVGCGLGYWELSDAINLVEDALGDQIPNMLAWTVEIGDSTASARTIATLR